MQNPRNLQVTEQARGLALAVYRVTAAFPTTERFGLASQMRRAAVSIGSNIAEGCGRQGDRALLAFLHIALGSASELEFQFELAASLGLAPSAELSTTLAELQHLKRRLVRLVSYLKRHPRAD